MKRIKKWTKKIKKVFLHNLWARIFTLVIKIKFTFYMPNSSVRFLTITLKKRRSSSSACTRIPSQLNKSSLWRDCSKRFLKLVFCHQKAPPGPIRDSLESFLFFGIFHGAIQIFKTIPRRPGHRGSWSEIIKFGVLHTGELQLPGIWDTREMFFFLLDFLPNFNPFLLTLKQQPIKK